MMESLILYHMMTMLFSASLCWQCSFLDPSNTVVKNKTAPIPFKEKGYALPFINDHKKAGE